MLAGFSIVLESDRLSPDFRTKLVKLLKAHKGATPLSILLHDRATGYLLDFHSKKYAVAVCEPFISALQRLGVQYSVTRK